MAGLALTQVTRAATRTQVAAWISGELDAQGIWDWAQAQKVAQAEGAQAEDGLVQDIVDVLAHLPFDLITVEDGEIMLYTLDNPPEEADLGQNLLWNHFDALDTTTRRVLLRDDPFYGPYCGTIE